jgi:LmbE family N-acetylglucosaminyl deacetylase
MKVNDNYFDKDDIIVVLAPHPDDEVLGCAGALMAAKRAIIIYITDGRHGTPNGKVDGKLIKIRQKEATNGLKYLGSNIETVFLNNSAISLRPTRIIAKSIALQISTIASSNICLFTPWIFDDNPDHQATARLTSLVVKLISPDAVKQVWQYEVWSPLIPNRFIPLNSAAIRRKKKAIASHRSQLKSRAYDKAILGLNAYRGAISNINHPAEAYLALSPKEFIDFAKKT